MHKLVPTIIVAAEMFKRTANTSKTHCLAALNADGQHIIGCALICVFDSPTCRKANIEDVVPGSGFREQGIGKALKEVIIGFSQRELVQMDLNLTSRPGWVAANDLYRKLGFERMGTSVYRIKVKG